MERRSPPKTEEGWYVLHDCRTVRWDRWHEASDEERTQAVRSGVDELTAAESVSDADAGSSATYAVLGNKADIMSVHLRPTIAAIERLERRLNRSEFGQFTRRSTSYLSVTEISGYVSEEYFERPESVDPGTARYMESRLKPTIPDAEFVSFYPMDKRRTSEWNWYDLPLEERAEHIASHGEIGREHAGDITQIISSSIGFDDHEWGITLFAEDPVAIKRILYEMRFDPSTSRFAEFGQFLFGRRLPPSQLRSYLDGEQIDIDGSEYDDARDSTEREERDGPPDAGDDGDSSSNGIYSGQPHGEDVHSIVLYSTADADELFEAVDDLRSNFDHYDTHVKTAVYEPAIAADSGEYAEKTGEVAVLSIWETERAADIASGFLSDLPGIQDEDRDDESWGTMGMFYTVDPEYLSEFHSTFETVGDLLTDMNGHRRSTLFANLEVENDLFIASRWDSREAAQEFFRSDEFAETLDWGRDVLIDRPRHVYFD